MNDNLLSISKPYKAALSTLHNIYIGIASIARVTIVIYNNVIILVNR